MKDNYYISINNFNHLKSTSFFIFKNKKIANEHLLHKQKTELRNIHFLDDIDIEINLKKILSENSMDCNELNEIEGISPLEFLELEGTEKKIKTKKLGRPKGSRSRKYHEMLQNVVSSNNYDLDSFKNNQDPIKKNETLKLENSDFKRSDITEIPKTVCNLQNSFNNSYHNIIKKGDQNFLNTMQGYQTNKDLINQNNLKNFSFNNIQNSKYYYKPKNKSNQRLNQLNFEINKNYSEYQTLVFCDNKNEKIVNDNMQYYQFLQNEYKNNLVNRKNIFSYKSQGSKNLYKN
ncbi:hypothetical protein GVAV_000459 [Gurleya vavrai]